MTDLMKEIADSIFYPDPDNYKDEIILNIQQEKAVELMENNNIGILYGGPGTGKTTVLKFILEKAIDKSISFALAAPTGKATKRMTETTEFEAITIHKLLEPTFKSGQFIFKRNKKKPLSEQFIVVDEGSMVNNWLMASLMKAITPEHKLLIIGDDCQLQSVGCGAVLRDMIASEKIPMVELTEIQRNSGDLVKACHLIKAGQVYEPSTKLNIESGANLRHIECSSDEGILNLINVVYDKAISLGYDPIWSTQTLSPINRDRLLSCDGLNEKLQARFNPTEPVDRLKFRENDKVINIKNKSAKAVNEKGELLLVNGDMGTVLYFNNKTMVVMFENPDRMVEIPKYNNDLLLAYACTVHRYQGSECPICIIPIHQSIGYMIDRSWIYTAISRASDACITIGEFDIIKQAISRTNSMNRKTFLKERIIENNN